MNELLRAIGRGDKLDAVLKTFGMTTAAFDLFWRRELARRQPSLAGASDATVGAPVEIVRDARGVPHIFATDERDLFVGYGFAMAQDRLFQLDLRRRRGQGRLAEVLGRNEVPSDVLARTVRLPILAAAELRRLDRESLSLLEAFSDGVNAAIKDMKGTLPIEFALLAYEPEPWTPFDSLCCVGSWRWQFSGRLWVISTPEFAKRVLPDVSMYEAFLRYAREASEVVVLHPGEYSVKSDGLVTLDIVAEPSIAPITSRAPTPLLRESPGEGPTTAGSNNWVIAGSRSRSGGPILASDPHMPYESESFYEVHLSGGAFEAAGAGLVGVPGLTFGRNRHLAWGITNNLCSQRDLYLEVDGDAPRIQHEELITVRDGDPIRLRIESTARGPIVDHLLPPQATPKGPVSLRWVGELECDWFAAQLRLNRADSVSAAHDAIRGWLCPTFNLLLADDSGHIGYHATGAIPIRGREERGFRNPHDPTDNWQGLVGPDAMPHTTDPARGWLASANNAPAAGDYPYPLFGTWSDAIRAQRIGILIERDMRHDRDTFGRMQVDVVSERARKNLPALLAVLEGSLEPEDREPFEILRSWNLEMSLDSPGAAIWAAVTGAWTFAVTEERFPEHSVDFLSLALLGLAMRLLSSDETGWFRSDRHDRVRRCFREAVDLLRKDQGPDPKRWRWGPLHQLVLRHPLSRRGDLASLLAPISREVSGESGTVNNYVTATARLAPVSGGAGYRLIIDLGDPSGSVWAVNVAGQSCVPGSPHTGDQLDAFVEGRYYELVLDRERAKATAAHRLTLRPART